MGAEWTLGNLSISISRINFQESELPYAHMVLYVERGPDV